MPVDAAVRAETRWTMNRLAVLMLMSAWGVVALLTLMIDGFSSLQFLGLPLGAYLAGQGALVAGALGALRFARTE